MMEIGLSNEKKKKLFGTFFPFPMKTFALTKIFYLGFGRICHYTFQHVRIIVFFVKCILEINYLTNSMIAQRKKNFEFLFR